MDSFDIAVVGSGPGAAFAAYGARGRRILMLDGSHLFPMEQPVTTAAAIEASLLNLAHIAPNRG